MVATTVDWQPLYQMPIFDPVSPPVGLYIQPAMQPHGKELPLKAPVEVPGITLCLGLGHMSARSQGMITKGKLWKSKFGKIVDVHYTLVAGKLPVKGTFKYTKHFTDL